MTDKLVDVLNEIKAKEWNLSIAPRAPQILSLLHEDTYQNGILAWMKSVEQRLDQKLRYGCKDRDEDQFVRGQIAMLSELIELGDKIDAMMKLDEERKKMSGSRGAAGY